MYIPRLNIYTYLKRKCFGLSWQHFIDTSESITDSQLLSGMGTLFLLRDNDVNKPVNNGSRTAKQKSISGVYETDLDTNLTITHY